MQVTLRPDGWLERIALWLNLGPTPVALSFFGMMASRTAMAGVRLGLFRALSTGPLAETALAERLSLSLPGTRQLLQALAILELVRWQRGEWALHPRMRPWLDPAAPRYIGDFLEFNYAQWDWWSNLEEAIRTGQGPQIHAFPPEDPRWRAYVLAMFQLARLGGDEVTSHLKLRAPRSLLDIGGSHGWFAELLCRRYPSLQAEVMELPGALEAGRALLEDVGTTGRVRHVRGHAGVDPLGAGRDVILLFQVLHHLSESEARTLLTKIHASLAPGGTLAITEFFAEPPSRKPDASALVGLHYFLTSSATAYPQAVIRGWIEDAGFRLQRAARLRRIPFQHLLIATRK